MSDHVSIYAPLLHAKFWCGQAGDLISCARTSNIRVKNSLKSLRHTTPGTGTEWFQTPIWCPASRNPGSNSTPSGNRECHLAEWLRWRVPGIVRVADGTIEESHHRTRKDLPRLCERGPHRVEYVLRSDTVDSRGKMQRDPSSPGPTILSARFRHHRGETGVPSVTFPGESLLSPANTRSHFLDPVPHLTSPHPAPQGTIPFGSREQYRRHIPRTGH